MILDWRPYWFWTRRELLKMLPRGFAGWALLPMTEKLGLSGNSVHAVLPNGERVWTAKWIWTEGEPAPKNFYLYCRRSFTLNADASHASVDVAADSRYKLFLNGRFVGRGPARCDQRWQYYDSHDVRPFLQRGENVISAIVHQYGAPSHSYTLGRGGFFLQGEAREAGGRTVRMDTDENWRVLVGSPWDRESARTCVAVMWQEIYDAQKEPVGWQRAGFDDSHWRPAVILGTSPVEPWENLVARDIPFLREEEVSPTAIVNSGLVDPAPPALSLDIPKLLGQSNGVIAYLFAYLNSPADQQVSFVLRDRDGNPPMMSRFWVNGTAEPESNPLWPSPSNPIFSLKRGWNELLIKLARSSPAWRCDLSVGPAPQQPFAGVQWYAESDTSTPAGRAWLTGPYGEMRPVEPGGPNPYGTAYEPEKIILGRAAGTPVHIPGKIVDLNFGTPKNIALIMAAENRHPQPTPGLQHPEHLLRADAGPVVISTDGQRPVYATIDFGKETSGFLRLRLKGVAGGIVDIGYCETLVNGFVDTLRDHWSFADRYIMRAGPQEWELFFWKGFRYVQLTFRNCPRPVELEAVRAAFTSYPVEYRGSFECSDSLLTKIWEVGRWTLQNCMHDGYEDCPWREQGQWCGDAQVELKSNYYVFGDIALGSKCLKQIAQGQSPEGALPAEYPADITVYPTRHSAPFGIPTFMAQWASMVLDHYRYSGDSKLVSELYPNLVRVMAYLGKYLDTDGLLNNVPGFGFLDWAPELMSSPIASRGEITGINCHYYRGLIDAAALAGLVGEKRQQVEWLRQAEGVKRNINENLWSEEHRVYAHQRVDGQLEPKLAVHDSVLAVYAGVAPPERAELSVRNVFSLPGVVPIGTPYFYYFYLQALRRLGMHQEALDAIRKSYGKMLDEGATAWWEHFSGFASLCHAWSSAPSSDLPANVLGVQLTEPGFNGLRVEPQPADVNWAKGVMPTPRGDIAVSWKHDGAAFQLDATVPMQAMVELSVPARNLQSAHLSSKQRAQKQEFSGGRARYWVQAPGTFRVETHL